MGFIVHIANLYRFMTGALIVVLLLILLTTMGAQIVLRYALNASLIWADEACRYLFVWISFLACVLAYERGEMGAFTLFRDSMPRRLGLLLAIATNLLAVLLLAVLTWYGFQYAARVGSQPVPALNFLLTSLFGGDVSVPSMFWVYLALPIGFASLAVRIFCDVIIYMQMFYRTGSAADLRSAYTE